MQVVHSRQPFPTAFSKAIFLAGPTPRDAAVPSWRPEAIRLLESRGYDGVIITPEDADGSRKFDYDDQVEWEDAGLHLADCILFWVPRELTKMPAFTTNHEHGEWYRSGKLVFGAPPDAPKNRYLITKAKSVGEPTVETLEATVDAALAMIGDGAPRTGGECQVPLHIWSTPSFQHWYADQKAAGNRLDGAKVEWVFKAKQDATRPFMWALHVNVFVARENRNKTNEVVLSRPDISSVLLYRKAADPLDTRVVLVREFRSPAATKDGCVHELPGGSTFHGEESARQTAAEEVKDETGLAIAEERLVPQASRQLASTMLSHKSRFFSAEVTEEELAELASRADQPQGVVEDSERTYVEIKTLREILASNLVDWSTLGMILSVLR